jgi:hypothetical protein
VALETQRLATVDGLERGRRESGSGPERKR